MCLAWNKRRGCAPARRTPWITSITANPSHTVIFFYISTDMKIWAFCWAQKLSIWFFPYSSFDVKSTVCSTSQHQRAKKKTKAEKRQLFFSSILHMLLTDIHMNKIKKENFYTSQISHRQDGWVWVMWHYVEVHLSQRWRRQSLRV